MASLNIRCGSQKSKWKRTWQATLLMTATLQRGQKVVVEKATAGFVGVTDICAQTNARCCPGQKSRHRMYWHDR